MKFLPFFASDKNISTEAKNSLEAFFEKDILFLHTQLFSARLIKQYQNQMHDRLQIKEVSIPIILETRLQRNLTYKSSLEQRQKGEKTWICL